MKFVIAAILAVALLSGTVYATTDWEAAYNEIAATAEKYRLMIPDLEKENDDLRAEIETLEIEVNNLKTELGELDDVETIEITEDANVEQEFYDDGSKAVEHVYQDNTINSTVIWYENGNKKSEEIYWPNGRIKILTHWYENGNKLSESKYAENGDTISILSWYENGAKLSENSIDNNGNEVFTTWYKNGYKLGQYTYDSNGDNKHDITWYENGVKKEETTYDIGYDGANITITINTSYWAEDGTLSNSTCKVTQIVNRVTTTTSCS